MTRPARLESAKLWVRQSGPAPHGRGHVHRYSKWFCIDLGCAVVELQTPGVALDRTGSRKAHCKHMGGQVSTAIAASGSLSGKGGEKTTENGRRFAVAAASPI
ncbi:MAG: hypothetical protein HY815_07870 [Candidatus Riflebacteria bacterium]|nr:hypothetical protein [Candidatus Riflebacteria bacterium]